MRIRATGLLVFATVYVSGAYGSGFQIRENSAEGLGRAFAGSAATPGEAAVIYNNPAAMSLFGDRVVRLDLSAIDLSFDFDGEGADALGRPLTGGTGGDAGDLIWLPAAYFAMPLGQDWNVGVSLSAPFGLRTEYDEGWIGRYQALKSDLATVNLALSLSYDLTDNFALGGSANVQYADAELSRAIDFGAILAGTPGTDFAPQSADGTSTLSGDDYALGWTLGALWRFSEQVNVGLSYHSEIDHTLAGRAEFDVPAEAAAVFASLPGDLFTDTDGRADLTTPATATLSVHAALTERFDVMADLSRTFWDSFDELRIEFDNPAQDPVVEIQDWSDTWFASVGAEYSLNEQWTLRGGLAYDETPTNDVHRSPRIPGADRRWASAGVAWQPVPEWTLDLGYARLFTSDASISNASETGSTLNGEVEAETHIFGLSSAYRF